MNTPESNTRFVRLLFVTICLILSVVTPHYAQKPFAIKDKRLLFESAPDPCQTNAEIRSREGGYQTTGLVERRGGKFWLWCNGARHTWIGRSTDIEGAIAVIDSDTGDPLQFKVDRSEGYVYVKGKGRISMPNGQVIILPEVPTSGAASEEGRRESHPAALATADDQIQVRAYLWPYESLCNLPEPAEHMKRARIGGNFGTKGCRNLEQEWGKPAAVRINLVNAGDSEVEFVIKDLASILLKNRTGGTVAALGFLFRLPDAVVGSTVGIVSKFDGSIAVSVSPGKGLDFIVLFKNAVAGDSIIISENKPIEITARE